MQEIVVGIVVAGAFVALVRMWLARAGIGRAKPDCNCGTSGNGRGKRAR